MDISLRIVIPSLLLFALFIVDLAEGQNGCPESRCGEDGPDIRFPFRLKDRQPDQQCGYPGFDLYCSHNNDTVLELPTSVKTFVSSIDYEFQLIHLTFSNSCFPRGLNISSSPFQFNENKYVRYKHFLHDLTVFNCTRETTVTDSCQEVYVFPSDSYIADLPILSCRKIYSFSSDPHDSFAYGSPFVELTWSRPKCGYCEEKGKKCRFENNSTDLKTECFDPDKDKVDRPSMKVVVPMLEGEGDKLTMPPNPFASTSPTRINVSMLSRRLNQELEVILESE
ncbi:putative ring-h2 finger protein atl21a [Quercus suber]|uniref:RING-type E3 ubiquitin transferase n=1 Tax=Quercus suber TaxID=58331 RepID=A0AAW0JKY9_QUESU